MIRVSTSKRSPILFVVMLLLSFLTATRGAADDESTRDRRYRQLHEKRQTILDDFQRDLESVQNWCNEHDLPVAKYEVAKLALKIQAPDPDSAPSKFVTPPVSKSLPFEDQQWQLQLRHHREERAKELYMLARATLRAGFPSLAFTMIGDVIRIDPDHKFARSILGTQLFADPSRKDDPEYAGEWVCAFEKQKRSGSRPQIYHSEYGWIPESSLDRYNEGLRPWKNDWISKEKEAEQRRNFRNAWEIPSENFLVRTNVSLEAGVRLSQRLEIFNDWLQKNFAAFFETPKTLQDRFENASSRSSSRKQNQMKVHYYKTREEYQRSVEGKVPPNIETNGLYWEEDATSYFFENPEKSDYSTLYHEATHQILELATRDARKVAAKARSLKLKQRGITPWRLCENSNFWILEGIACYFESFDVENGTVSVGRPDFQRIDIARQRIVDPMHSYYLPGQQLAALGQEQFKLHPQIAQLYTQGAGFAHFLMHFEDGLYRDDLITLLSEIYRPDPDAVLEEPSLPRISGVSFENLDRQYFTYMQNLIPQLEQQ